MCELRRSLQQGDYLAWIFLQWQGRVMISIIATRNFDVVVNSCWVKQAKHTKKWPCRFSSVVLILEDQVS